MFKMEFYAIAWKEGLLMVLLEADEKTKINLVIHQQDRLIQSHSSFVSCAFSPVGNK
jgi:hypothetical protein